MTLGSDILSKFSCQVLKSVYNLITLRPVVYAMLEQTRVGRIPHEIAGDLLNRARCNDPCGSRCFHGELCVGYSAVLKLVVHPFGRSKVGFERNLCHGACWFKPPFSFCFFFRATSRKRLQGLVYKQLFDKSKCHHMNFLLTLG